MRDFHCCATCIHFEVRKSKERTVRMCARLGYETNPTWKFNCWEPKDHVKRLMEKDKGKQT
ncbi:hypothetical protein N781_04540 [Pontibacillus halophilus JSM 076056 = DSM 19796]|uniref:Uncharacterized protein n=1 Tax=Pontibacillus halophilus JSM 076056 = DSM 19796 TaxID=1385510 RepID=A0A0A5I680_9BACI|nr:hypothetical protein [Pontibacillus halophilus]KGX91337.1 hypothetical protein N781_04540 [Pontibacillus halophilus JSM 076056 = DSM 19796]